MNKRKREPIKPLATPINDLLPADVQTAMYYMTIKTKKQKRGSIT